MVWPSCCLYHGEVWYEFMCSGYGEEFKEQGVAVNALWPRTAIATAAIKNALGGEEVMHLSRDPEIMGDAAYVILTKPLKFTEIFV